jgi:hypothetical protein
MELQRLVKCVLSKGVLLLGAMFLGMLSGSGIAQMDTTKVFGYVIDGSGRYMANVDIELVDLERGLRRTAKTNSDGYYVFPAVRPATYRLQASKPGFRTMTIPNYTVILQEHVAQSFRLLPGEVANATIQTRAASLSMNGAVSTVVDNALIANLPLNGRSFQTLFQLTPGVVIAPTSFASQGQFAVNGQRTDANYFVVDGVSANFGIAGGVNPGQSAGGWLPALSVFGSTNSLVSTDDVQEFAVLTSSYSAEFGRVPGGQISIITRSGTNKFTGNVFDYLRNDAFDANDWFANHENLPRSALRQNDFGGVLGGPIVKDKSFFFGSFEGLQLRQPTSSVTEVPSITTRNSAPAAVKPFLDAYPLPNGPENGAGLAQATYGFSNPSSLESLSLRIDHHFRESLSAFARYAHSVSDGQQRGAGSDALSTVTDTHFGLQTLTTGIEYSINPRIINDFRFNWSKSLAGNKETLDDFGGAIPLAQQLVFPTGFSANNGLFQFLPTLTPQTLELEIGRNVNNKQEQINLVDDVSYQIHGHLIKAGIDFRQLSPETAPASYTQQSFFSDIRSALINEGLAAEIVTDVPVHAVFRNYSVFTEDTWRPFARLSATLGIRWDFASPPDVRGANGLQPFALTGFSNLPELSLAQKGTPLYQSSRSNFAPRIGFACETRRSARAGSVVRGGAGIYYDLSNGPVGNTLGAPSFPFTAAAFVSSASLPLSPGFTAPPAITTNPPFSAIEAFPSVLSTPYSYHWNLSLDQAIGTAQTLSISYVGAAGHGLLRTEEYVGGEAGVPAAFTQILLTDNAGYSSFNSLQVKVERRTGPAHIIASYSLAHALDNVSTDVDFNGIPGRFLDPRFDYGPSDFDIRHTARLGLDYALPDVTSMTDDFRSFISGWSVDPIVTWRSSPPVDPVVSRDIGFGVYNFRPDLIPGVPLYLSEPQLPGGRVINVAALSVPNRPRQGDLGRNFFRGFPLFQGDVAIRRSFRLTERIRLQARVEAFNLFNHPNFAPPTAQLGTVDTTGKFISQSGFGISQTTLAQGLQGTSFGSGLSPVYQIGAARSLQLALKVDF